ncbi:MAG: DNA-binding protein, partial [Gammaproteobacteria bacterium]|nr:DNA-binding protein [Gammaproteobacteria bacterium]NIU05155.1 DNA-binding protein [Gammaproteobacteria bacterium]NIV51985.1 DNA-binding protein [Gammaproteobacteria bacterium]NIX86428.1 DNA-binding protein [Gammaproteobacteria bacterium]
QQRQEWYREYARSLRGDPLPFIGSVRTTDDITTTAQRIRDALGFNLSQRERFQTWTEA